MIRLTLKRDEAALTINGHLYCHGIFCTMSEDKAKDEFAELLRYLEYTLHELPAGVLYDANGANAKKCAELMSETYRLEKLSEELGIDLSEFIATCRWHYERYPHYLSRHKHFGSYAIYMAKYQAPTKTRAK
jgi:hypothetical protein